jgi:Tol biopolymer transport system component
LFFYTAPEWSPDGQRIYFVRGSFNKGGDVRSIGFGPDAKVKVHGWNEPGAGRAIDVQVNKRGQMLVSELIPHPISESSDDSSVPRVMLGNVKSTDFTELKGPSREFAISELTEDGQILAEASNFHDSIPVMKFNHRAVFIPATTRQFDLDEQTVTVKGLGMYFPSISNQRNLIVGVPNAGRTYTDDGPRPLPLLAGAADGSELKAIDHATSKQAIFGVRVSPRGDWIYYTVGKAFAAVAGDNAGRTDVCRIRPDGREKKNLTKAMPGNSKWPDISADGSKVVFARKLSNSESAIFMMNASGSGVQRLTKGTGYFTQPAISPDGSMIAFVGNLEGKFKVRHGPFRIYLLSLTDPDAKPQMLEPRNGKLGEHAADMHPNFSPDGKYVAFTTSRFGFGDEPSRSFRGLQPYGEICVAPVDGSFPAVRVTHNKWEDGIPDWDTVPVRPSN